MLPTTPIGTHVAIPGTEPQLTDRTPNPRGVVQKNMKIFLYLGAVLVLVLATLISSFKKKPSVAAKSTDAPAPVVQDNTANNVAAFHSQFDTERLRRTQEADNSAVPSGTPALSGAVGGYGATGLPVAPVGCVPGHPCSQVSNGSVSQAGGNGQAQLSPAEQTAQQLAAKEKERLYTSRFASNLAFASGASQEPGQATPPSHAANLQPGQPTNLTAGRDAGEQAAASQTYKRSAE